MPKIRVLRLIEYVYDTQERADADQGRWQMPAIGWRRVGDMMIRSTIIADLNFGEDFAEKQDKNDRQLRRSKNRCPCSNGPELHTYGWHDA